MASQNEQASVTRDRVKYRLPDEARDVLDLVNSVDPFKSLPPLSKIKPQFTDASAYRRHLLELLDGIPQWFTEKCQGRPEMAYRCFRVIRRSLRDLANLAAVPEYLQMAARRLDVPYDDEIKQAIEESGAVFFDEAETEEYQEGIGGPGWPGYLVAMEIGADGRIDLVPDDIIGDALRAFAGVIAERLRICENPNCRRLFYADRETRIACNPKKCGPLVRQRRRRESLKTARKLKRSRKAK